MSEHLFLAEPTVYDPGAGSNPIVNWSTVGDASWTPSGTPTRSAAAAYVGGYPLDLIGDDSGAAFEFYDRAVGFTGNADKIVSFLVKKNSSYPEQRIAITDTTAGVDRLSVVVDFTAAVPVVTAPVGSLLATVPLFDGYWIIAKAAGVIAANANVVRVVPASFIAGDTASFYIGVVRAWDSATYVGPTILRYSNGPFVTGPAETPANTWYDQRILQPALVRRDLFALGATMGASRIGFGDLVLANGDGGLDVLIDYGFDGWPITVWQGSPGAAYPGGFTKMLVATMQQIEPSRDRFVIKLRDRQQELDRPLQPTKYAGDNALPAGLEGVASDLKGKPKPVCFGKVLNVPAICVNTSKLIYQVNDGAISNVDVVKDRGVALGLKRFVAVAGGPNLASSDDGFTWTLRTSGIVGYDIQQVDYGGGRFVCVAGAQLSVSDDGIVWRRKVIPKGIGGNDINFRGVAYGLGRWVAAGQWGLLISDDAEEWTFVPGATNPFGRVRYLNNVFVSAELNGTWFSTDGVSWVNSTLAIQAYDATYGAGLYVVVGYEGVGVSAIYTSPDMLAWTQRTPPASHTAGVYTGYRGATYTGALFVVVGENGFATPMVATSSDAIAWTARTSATIGGLRNVTVGDGLLVAVGDVSGGNNIQTSTDGIAWTGGTIGVSNNVYGVSYGANVGVNAYASQADLLDDALAPPPGKFREYLAGGYFRLGVAPAGLVTADFTEGAAAGDRTTAQVWKRALIRAGKSSADYSGADITALDALNDDVLGFWTADEITFAQLLDMVTGSIGAWWGVDRTGVFRIAQFLAPSGSPVLAFTANDLKRPLERVVANDPGDGLPVFKSLVRHSRAYAVQTDLAGIVSLERRSLVGQEWREAQTTDLNVQAIHPLSPQIVEDSLLTLEADAQAEATRRQALRGVRRDRFEFAVELNAETVVLDLGNVIRITHSRFGLSAGKLFRITGLEPNAVTKELALTVWG